MLNFGQLKNLLAQDYPSAAADPRTETSVNVLVSPEFLKLPRSVLARAQDTVKKLFHFSRSPDQLQRLQANLSSEDQEILAHRPGNFSALMSYDFHYDPTTDLMSLIEVNTNASLFLFSELLYRAHGIDLPMRPKELLLRSFQVEAGDKLNRVHIIDEDLQKQKAYAEFLMYKDFFKSAGVAAEILDFADEKVLATPALIYNRYCDFTLFDARSAHLRKAFLNRTHIFSPNPWEYLVLADKERMREFADFNVASTIIPQRDFRTFESAEALWAERKKYFFKPKRSHGSKAVFNGGSMSKKRFTEIFPLDYVAQEFRPPGKHGDWKYDLRFYVYKDEIQLYVARLYQGQLTNFGTPGGGLAPIDFI